MEKLPKISIIIPSFNKVNFIKETLNSIFDQKYPNLEVIIQDGGSTDGTVEIIKKFYSKYPNIIKWVSKKDKGQSYAINVGLKKVTGEIISYINADDLYERGAFNNVLNAYRNNPNSLWFAGKSSVINENGVDTARFVNLYKNILLSINSYTLLLVVNYLMQPSVFFTKEFYKTYGSFTGTGKIVLEYEKWLEVGKKQMPIVINKNLSKFRLYKTAFSSSFYNSILGSDLEIVNKYTKNTIILFLHKMHNIARKIIANLK